jgi:phage terminase large subunit-like protein
MTDNPTPTPPKPKKKRKPRKLDPNRTLLKDMTYEERQAYKKKTCSVCKKTKNKTQFNKDRRSKDGKHHMCKLCNRQNKAWWLYGKPEEEKPMSKNGLPLHVDDLRAMGKDVVALIKQLPPAKAEELKYNWRFWARENQIAPEGDWNNLLILAGRGFGKTRAGAEWIREQVKKGKKRIMAVAATNSDIERVMVKGESGLLSVCWKGDKTDRGADMGYPVWSPTKRTMTWDNGATVTFFSAEEPERLRGPQGDAAWCFIAGTKVSTPQEDKSVENIVVGDYVTTRQGPRKVSHTSIREMPVGKVVFSNGRELVGTADHPIMTQRGWVNMAHLKQGDQVCVIPASSSTVKTTTCNKMVTTHLTAQKRSNEKIDTGYTERFGNTTTALSQKGTKYTTSITSGMTTELRTWNSSRPLSTVVTMLSSVITSTVIGLKNLTKTITAQIAESLSKGRKTLMRLFAPSVKHAGQKTIGKHPETVSNAEQHSYQELGTSVVSVVSTWADVGQANVYNIKVEDVAEYYANGILTHNCDEICAWNKDRETWDMLQFCLRLGKHPQVFITTTPKPTKLLREILKNPTTTTITGSTYDNAANLAKTYLEAVKTQYEGTRLGRQELHAEVLDEASGSLWTREILSTCEVDKEDIPDLVRVIVSVDPAVTSKEDSDETGIIVAGIDREGISYILEDHSGTYTPEGWASKAVELYEVLEADCIVAEVNQGGDMVRHTIHTVDPDVPVRMVRASRGKALRAEPVASLYERGKVKHVKGLDKLEDQMVQWEPLGRHSSPDRLDAAVQAVVNLALKNVTLPSLNLGYQSAKGLLSR